MILERQTNRGYIRRIGFFQTMNEQMNELTSIRSGDHTLIFI